MSKKDLSFILSLQKSADPDEALEAITAYRDIKIARHLKRAGILVCRTTQKTYELVFNAKLEHDESQAGAMGYTENGYCEVLKAQIPKNLEKYIRHVHPNIMRKFIF